MVAVPGLGRSPKGGDGNPLQYSYLENSMDREVQKVLRASPPHRETYAVSNEAGASGALKGDIQGLWTLLTARPPPPHHHLQTLGLTQ